MELAIYIFSALIAIISFFLRSIYADLKSNAKDIENLKARVSVAESVNKNIDTLTMDIKSLTANVANMNGNMKVQSDILNKVFDKILSNNH